MDVSFDACTVVSFTWLGRSPELASEGPVDGAVVDVEASSAGSAATTFRGVGPGVDALPGRLMTFDTAGSCASGSSSTSSMEAERTVSTRSLQNTF